MLTVVLLHTLFQSRYVQQYIIKTITNSVVSNSNAKFDIGRVSILWPRRVSLNNVYLGDENNDTLLYCNSIVASIDSLHILKKQVHFSEIKADHMFVGINKTDSTSFNFDFLMRRKSSASSNPKWIISSQKLMLRKSSFSYVDTVTNKLPAIYLQNIILAAEDIYYNPESGYSFNIENIKFDNNNDKPSIRGFKAEVSVNDTSASISNINIASAHSVIDIPKIGLNYTDVKELGIGALDIDIEMSKVKISIADLGYIKPIFSEIYNTVSLSGNIYGSINDLHCHDIKIAMSDIGNLSGDLYINGLPDINQSYIFAKLNESMVNVSAIHKIKLPSELKKYTDELPSVIDNFGIFRYRGNFTGFITDFVAYGTFYSNLGIIEGDLSFKPGKIKSTTAVNGHLSTKDLNLGLMLKNEELEKLNASGNVNGWFHDNNKSYKLAIDGNIQSIGFRKYNYSNIQLDGDLEPGRFNGNLSVDDPNLALNFFGEMDISNNNSNFKFSSTVDHANLGILNLYKDSSFIVGFEAAANFSGNNLDNFTGDIAMKNIFLKNKADSTNLDYIDIRTSDINDSSFIELNSNWFNLEIIGDYKFSNITSSLTQFYNNYLPSSIIRPIEQISDSNEFYIYAYIKDTDPFTEMFMPKLHIETPFDIAAMYKPNDKNAWIETDIPFIEYNKKRIKSLSIRADGNENDLICNIKAENIYISKKITLDNLTVTADAKSDTVALDILWDGNHDILKSSTIHTSSAFSISEYNKPHIDIHLQPSDIILFDSIWQISDAHIEIDTTSITFKQIRLSQQEQMFLMNGSLAKDNISTTHISLKEIDFRLLEKFWGRTAFTGIIDGDISFGRAIVDENLNLGLTVRDFSFSDGVIGDMSIVSKWDDAVNMLTANINIDDKESKILSTRGHINPQNADFDLDVKFDKTSISFLNVLMPSVFEDIKGMAEGDIKITGPVKHLMFDGTVYPIGPISVGLSALKTAYRTSDPFIFSHDSIIFSNMRIRDQFDNEGLFNGYLTHKSFFKMKYDMEISSDNLQVMNMTYNDNNYFYGTAFVNGRARISGIDSDVLIEGKARSTKGTQIFIPFETPNSAQSHSFIEFLQNNDDTKTSLTKVNKISQGLEMDFDIEITPDAKVQLIINSQLGDVIKGEGNGNLRVKIDKYFNIDLYGNYTIDKGDYMLNFQNILSKKFSIENGGTLNWSGDPYNAEVDITAVYRLSTTLYDLFLNTYSDIDVSRRIPVNCSINLTGDLLTPKIEFGIDLPTSENRIKDLVNQTIVTEEDKNKQMISLLLLGKFYTPDFMTGTSGEPGTISQITGAQIAQSTVSTTASELLSNQLTSWVNQLSGNIDVGFNYRKGDGTTTTDQYEVALESQILNDRVILNGNIANNANTNTNAANQDGIVGDFDLLIKLTDNGKLQFKAYSHSNDQMIYEMAPYTQGVGFSYHEEFNTFKGLMRKYRRAIFGRKKD